jgi:5-methylcytosine-specific restriction enzyme A
VKPRIKTITNRIETADLSRGARIQTERIRGHKLTVIRQRILLRDEYTCQICGRVSARPAQLEVHHDVPLGMGGAESDENRRSLCKDCHRVLTRRDRG